MFVSIGGRNINTNTIKTIRESLDGSQVVIETTGGDFSLFEETIAEAMANITAVATWLVFCPNEIDGIQELVCINTIKEYRQDEDDESKTVVEFEDGTFRKLDIIFTDLEGYIALIPPFNGVDGNDGADAPLVKVTESAHVFKVDNDGNVDPANITISATVYNIDTPLYDWYKKDPGDGDWVLLEESTSALTVSSSDVTGTRSIRVVVNGMYEDTTTIAKIIDGSDSYVAILTNESHSIPTDSDGNNPDLTEAKTDIIAFRGADQLSPIMSDPILGQFSFIINSTTNCTAVKSDEDSISITGITSNSASVEVLINLENKAYITRVMTLSKSIAGITPLSFIWKGAVSDPSVFGDPEPRWIYKDIDDGIVYVRNEDNTAWEIMTMDGSDGEDGINAPTMYTWVKYADDALGTNISDLPEGKSYIGLSYNNLSQTESADPADYSWSLIKGEQGIQGDDGLTYYTWIKYADDNLGTNMTDDPSGKVYIGIAYNKNTPIESADYTDYLWAQFRGDQGLQGDQGLSVFITYNDSPIYATPPTPTGNGTTDGWHTNLTADVKWISQKVAISSTEGVWGTPVCIKGADGADGADGSTGHYLDLNSNGGIFFVKTPGTDGLSPAHWSFNGAFILTTISDESFIWSSSGLSAELSGSTSTKTIYAVANAGSPYITGISATITVTSTSGIVRSLTLRKIDAIDGTYIDENGVYTGSITANQLAVAAGYSSVDGIPAEGADVTSENVSADTANVNGVPASTVQANASAAISAVTAMSSDSILSAQEKTTWRNQWPGMLSNYDSITAFATSIGIGAGNTAYDNLVTSKAALYNYLVAAGVWSNPTVDYTITGTDLVDRTSDYYDKLQKLSEAINTKIQSNAEENSQTYVDGITSIINSDIATLQSQVDGSITTWFYDGVPSLVNDPAVNWATDEDKNVHLGDIYYDNLTGFSYRFKVDTGTYSWARITDSDITAALASAASAQDTADAKRRIFVVQPVPPYDIGDLWVEGSSGDIKKCTIAKTEGQSYASGDWSLASKYTDDTAATNIVNGTTDLSSAAVGGLSLSSLKTTVLTNQTAIDGMADDGILSPSEKTTWRLNWPTIQSEYDIAMARATELGISSGTEYDELVLRRTNLYNYLVAAGVWSAPTVSYTITGTEFSDAVALYSAALQTFFTRILVQGPIDENTNITLATLAKTSTYDTFIVNYNERNDMNSVTPADPTVYQDTTGITHEVNQDGSSNIFIKWIFDGSDDAHDIDGFIVYAYSSTSNAAYTLGTDTSKERLYYFDTTRREFALLNMISLRYFTFGVQSYRIVDGSVNSTGILKSSIVQINIAPNNPYYTDITVPNPSNVQMTVL